MDLKDGCLTVSAVKGLDKDEEDRKGRYIRQERYAGACSRSFYVGDVEPDQVTAKYEDGILRISMPKEPRKSCPSAPPLPSDDRVGARGDGRPLFFPVLTFDEKRFSV